MKLSKKRNQKAGSVLTRRLISTSQRGPALVRPVARSTSLARPLGSTQYRQLFTEKHREFNLPWRHQLTSDKIKDSIIRY